MFEMFSVWHGGSLARRRLKGDGKGTVHAYTCKTPATWHKGQMQLNAGARPEGCLGIFFSFPSCKYNLQ